MSATVIIPARHGSTRFPGKALANETGRPLVQHVVDQCRKCKRVREAIVATDDERIVAALKPFDTRCVMTSAEHQSGTDRIAEAARDLKDDIIVNVQGDEPEIEPETIDRLIEHLQTSRHDMATAATRFRADQNAADPNLVKVVMDETGRAMYFSRSAIPFARDGGEATYHLHVGIYAYRRPFLMEFASWQQTPCERVEKLEQLRALEHGKSIGVIIVDRAAHGIDTPEQYASFVNRTKKVNREATKSRSGS